jgi:hypothetical protein
MPASEAFESHVSLHPCAGSCQRRFPGRQDEERPHSKRDAAGPRARHSSGIRPWSEDRLCALHHRRAGRPSGRDAVCRAQSNWPFRSGNVARSSDGRSEAAVGQLDARSGRVNRFSSACGANRFARPIQVCGCSRVRGMTDGGGLGPGLGDTTLLASPSRTTQCSGEDRSRSTSLGFFV